jgi:hypothetical protein
MKNKAFTLLLIIFTLSYFFISCENNSKNNKDEDDTTTTQLTKDETRFFYLVPSPEDLFEFTSDQELIFNPDLLNSDNNVEKYIDTKSKEINFGIYAADLAYCAAFSKSQETVEYLHIVRNISDKIGISAAFDESLLDRIENIDDNKDSLKTVSSDTYYDIVKFLEKNDRVSTLALISTGGWIESLYLVTNLISNYKENSVSIQRVADQKIIFSNLILYLQQNQEIESVSSTLEQIMPIKQIFDQLEVVTVESDNTTNNEGKIVVGGNTKIKITEEQYKKLKETIAKVRNNITGNNVTL